MKFSIAFAIVIALFGSAHAQYYDGPPGWGRWGNYESGGRWPRTHFGPNENCWRYGNCRGPRYEEDPEQSWRRPICRDYYGNPVPCR